MQTFLRFVMFAVVLGTIHLPQAVNADGKPLAAGTYQVRLTDEKAAPAVGQSVDAEQWVEFVQGGKVMGRELATVISAADMNAIAKGQRPALNGTLVEKINGEYVRVWINKDKTNYLINLAAGK